jgi:hypothetical protein
MSVVQKQRRFRREFDVVRYGKIVPHNVTLKWDDFNIRGNLVTQYVSSARSVRT